MAPLALLVMLIIGSPAAASAQSLVFEPRVGVVFSGPLVEDSLILPIEGDDRERSAPVRAIPDPAPVVSLELRAPSGKSLEMRAEAGLTLARLRGEDEAAEWDIQDLRVAHAVFGVRYERAVFEPRYETPRFVHVRGGLGAIRYSSSDSGIFSEGAELKALLEAGAGATLPVGGYAVTLGASGQWHRFSTVALRSEGGVDGVVWRAILQIGVIFGGSDTGGVDG